MVIMLATGRRAPLAASRAVGRPRPTLPAADWAAIELSRQASAQGPIVRRYPDGRVAISTGCGEVVGMPVR